MARDASLLPGNAAIQYRYGLALYLNGDKDQAEEALSAACRIEPNNEQFLFALVLFYDKYERFREALEGIDRLLKMRPTDRQYLGLQAELERKLKGGTQK